MLQDDVTIFLGMAGALSAGGLRLIVAPLHPASLRRLPGVHRRESLPRSARDPRPASLRRIAAADDAALAHDHIDRVYDTYASEEEFISNDTWIADFAGTLETRSYTTREFLIGSAAICGRPPAATAF